MGSKHRRKSKPARRHHAPAGTTANANERSTGGIDVTVVEDPPHAQVAVAPDETQREDHREDVPTPIDYDDKAIAREARDSNDVQSAPIEDPPPALTPQEARLAVERLFVAMLAAGMSPSQALTCTEPVVVATIEEQLEAQDTSGAMDLSPVQRRAIRVISMANDGSESVSVAPLLELASAATFRVEMLEFQIRQAVLDRAGNKSRGKTDFQRVLAKIASSLPDDVDHITAKQFESMLQEKLGVSAGASMLARVVFARIIGHPFVHVLPKGLTGARSAFFTAFETFVVDKPLSLDSVEGQLRLLITNHADLRASFRALDADDSGSISLDEFVTFLQREAHMNYPRGVLAAFIRRFDVDGDGSLSYDEFVGFVSPKQFGIQVLTPFGMFYQAVDRHELMGDVVAKIKTRMFWMQHNDLFATSTQPVYKPPLKLKVTDHFILTHHYGTLRLQYKTTDPIGKVLKNGEMVVLVLEPGVSTTTTSSDDPLPPFEYRLKPKVKRSIPPLLSWSLRDTPHGQAPPILPAVLPKLAVKPRAPTRGLHADGSNTYGDDDSASNASARTDATSRRLTSSSWKPERPSAHVRQRIASKSLACRSLESSLDAPQETVDTEEMCSQKGPLETQLQAAADFVADLPSVTKAPARIGSSSSDGTSSDYAYFERDNPTDEDEEEPENRGEGSEHENEDAFGVDSGAGDESAPTGSVLCVEDPTVDWDEDAPPPPYDG